MLVSVEGVISLVVILGSIACYIATLLRFLIIRLAGIAVFFLANIPSTT
ncbi:hypothetical protein SLEP1_g24239 [Rubroshorea leprosula]|uniref:Uncharacterized protein n=1 Tax=Rubroshorea leprosula TaxID=152421 RepID=A0AAV5JPB9_9ROSI|nr:hypothetical protein SLEP1_g24239 [Rubroshorea leprosula]